MKGGSGTTVVSSALALLLARTTGGALVVDLGGDIPAACGVPEPSGPGILDFAAAGDDVPLTALERLETRLAPNLSLLHAGAQGSGENAAEVLRSLTAADGERVAASLSRQYPAMSVVVDCGPPDSRAGRAIAAAAGLSLLVLRPCYLALRRASQCDLRPSGVILIEEPGRSLGAGEVADVLGVPVRAQVPYDAAVARVVDAGLLSSRVPRSIERALRIAA